MAKQKEKGIVWTDETWNPIRGCQRVSAGCHNCYAEVQAQEIIASDRRRDTAEGEGAYDGLIDDNGQWNGSIRFVPELLDAPVRWTKPRKIFVNSMSDLYHPNVTETMLKKILAVMALSDQHIFQVLTKRPKRMAKAMSRLPEWAEYAAQFAKTLVPAAKAQASYEKVKERMTAGELPNLWLGVSVEDQRSANKRIPWLMGTRAAVRWLSMEPLLGPVDIDRAMYGPASKRVGLSCFGFTDGFGEEVFIHWVVAGGESGDNARPMHYDWIDSVRAQCEEAMVPFMFKQWGEWAPRSECLHILTNGQSASDIDPSANKWPCIRLNNGGLDDRRLENVSAGDHPVYMQKVGRKLSGNELNGKVYMAWPNAIN